MSCGTLARVDIQHSPLITVSELQGIRDSRIPVTVLDVRWRLGGPPGAEEFVFGHIPGSSYVDVETELAAPPETGPGGRGRHPLPEPAEFAASMRRAGVCNDRLVVVYDDWSGRAAARCWWLLRWTGHPQVRVLDGGWSAWVRSGGDVEAGPGTASPGDFIAAQGDMVVVSAEDLEHWQIIDARAPERYSGEVEPVDPIAGRIPRAVNIPTDSNLNPDGTFRSPEELAENYADVGMAAVSCGSGVTACHNLLAMEHAGLRGVLYADSWSGYITDPKRPIETGMPV